MKRPSPRVAALFTLVIIALMAFIVIINQKSGDRYVHLLSSNGTILTYHARYARDENHRVYFCTENNLVDCRVWRGGYFITDQPLTDQEALWLNQN